MKYLFFLLMFFNLSTSYGQLKPLSGKPRQPTKKELEADERNHNCVYKKKYEAEQRLQFYPFNHASKVLLVSFQPPDSKIIGRLPMKNNSVDMERLKERNPLSQTAIDSLTDLLYNTGYSGTIFIIYETKCYHPRNAILFLDADEKPFAFIELCFECGGYKPSSNEVKTGDFCNQKYELLREFFAGNGITYGTEQ